MKKDGMLLLGDKSFSSRIPVGCEHTSAYGGEVAFLALVLSRLNSPVELMLCGSAQISESLEKVFKENNIRHCHFPPRQSADLFMSFSLASGAFGSAPFALGTTMPVAGSLFEKHTAMDLFKGFNFLLLPAQMLETEKGREISMSVVRLAEQSGEKIVFLANSCQCEITADFLVIFEEILPHISFLALGVEECQGLFDRKIETSKDCEFLLDLKIPLLWVDLEGAGSFFSLNGSDFFRYTSYLNSHKCSNNVAFLRHVFFCSLMWRLNTFKLPLTKLSHRELSSYVHFALTMVNKLPAHFSTPYDLPSYEEAKKALKGRAWWQFSWFNRFKKDKC